jgi:hypothetical protein
MPNLPCPECGDLVDVSEISTHWATAHAPVAEGVVIPDKIGEVVAWRAWKCQLSKTTPGGVELVSATRDSVWPHDDWMIAECPNHHDHKVEGGVPGKNCTCGIYAAKTREQLVNLKYGVYSEYQNVVIGEVAMVGKVIPGSQGWRASKARIKSILVPYEHWQMVAPLKKSYDVPVDLATTLVINPKEVM